jgi:hypothetical protein
MKNLALTILMKEICQDYLNKRRLLGKKVGGLVDRLIGGLVD